MNKTIIATFEKIFSDNQLIKEFLGLKGDEIFDFLKSHSDSDFTKEEFEDSMVELCEPLYRDLIGLEKLPSEELNAVAGGKGHLKKSVAMTMAALSLGSGVPFAPGGVNFAPEVDASWFGKEKRKNYDIPKPYELDEVKEYLEKDSYYKDSFSKNSNNIEEWWKNNINRLHTQPDKRYADKNTDSILDLAAVDKLLMFYYEQVAKRNGITTTTTDYSLLNFISNSNFETTVNECFGDFNCQKKNKTVLEMISPGYDDNHMINAHQRLTELILEKFASLRQIERDAFFTAMQKSAPALIGSFILFSKLGAIQQAKDLLIQGGQYTYSAFMQAYNRFIYNRLQLERDPIKLKELMSEYLKNNVFRQDKAMDRIVEIMSGMTDLWASSDASGKPCTSACTMTFMGDSGIGKTYAARMLSQALFHKDMQPWQFITSTSVSASSVSTSNSSTDEQLSPADQLFNSKSELVRQLKLNNRVIIVLDEIDKMHKADPNDTILERLRDARDTGKLLVRNGVNYDYIDVSRTVFICITNELRECWGLPAENLTEAQSAARTNIKRDKSLVNRFDVIEFDYLKSDDYAFILKPQLEELKAEYAEQYGININITDQLISQIAHAAEIKNKGVRGVNDFLVLLRGKLVDYRSKHKDSGFADEINFEYIPEANTFNIE